MKGSGDIYESLGLDVESGSGSCDTNTDLGDESILKQVSSVVLFVGVLSSIAILFTQMYSLYPYFDFNNENIVSWGLIAYSILSLISSIAVFAFLRVVANISTSLKLMRSDNRS